MLDISPSSIVGIDLNLVDDSLPLVVVHPWYNYRDFEGNRPHYSTAPLEGVPSRDFPEVSRGRPSDYLSNMDRLLTNYRGPVMFLEEEASLRSSRRALGRLRSPQLFSTFILTLPGSPRPRNIDWEDLSSQIGSIGSRRAFNAAGGYFRIDLDDSGNRFLDGCLGVAVESLVQQGLDEFYFVRGCCFRA